MTVDSFPTIEREALHEAIAERDNATEAFRDASETAERGKQLLRASRRKLEQFGDVDGAILQHRAASFKSAAQGGPEPSLALPPDLLRRESARDEAAAEVAAAKAAHGSLVGELGEAEAALRRADNKVLELSASVLVEEIGEKAGDLAAIWNDLWATVDSLNGLSLSGVRLPRELVSTLLTFEGMDHRQFAGNRNRQLIQAISYWKAYRIALCKSAEATGPAPTGSNEASASDRAA